MKFSAIVTPWLLFFLIVPLCLEASDRGSLVFEKDHHDFGTVVMSEAVSYEFAYENKGEKPVQIKSVRTSCGCTVPDYPTEAIAPGESGSITVNYKSNGMSGAFLTFITIVTDDKPEIIELSIEGEVVENAADDEE